jgi:hypothetical protein
MAVFYVRGVRAALLCVLLWPPGAGAGHLQVLPSLGDGPCRFAASDSWQEYAAYTDGKTATAVRPCTLDPVPFKDLLRLDAPLAGCGARVWETELAPCSWDANRVFESPHREGSPRALGVLVAALATPADTEVDPLTKPSQSLVLVEWTLVFAIVAFGLLRLTLGRD